MITNTQPDYINEFLVHMAEREPQMISDSKMLESFDKTVDDYKSGYFGGKVSRFLPAPPGVSTLGSNADYHYSNETEYFRMVERSRYFDRDNMIFGSGLNKVNANILQTGFMLQPKTGDDALDDELSEGWEEYSAANNFDFEQEKDFNQATEMVLRTTQVDGDVFAIPTVRNGRIQFLENHHCRNPWGHHNKTIGRKNKTGVVHGVELKEGKRVAYHFTPDLVGLGQLTRRYDTKRYSSRTPRGDKNVFQMYFPKRLSQHRGVGVAAPIVFPIQYNDDLQFAAMVNAKKQSFIAILREMSVAGEITSASRGSSGTREELTGGRRKVLKDGSPGQEFFGVPGETLKGFAANVPAPQHFNHTELLMTIVAINMDLPLIVFLLDGSKTNFNGYRGAIDQARQRYKIIQRDLIHQWHREVYRFYVRWRLFRDPRMRMFSSRSDINIFKHVWTPQGWDYIQPVQDAAADELQLSANLTSPRRRAQKRGAEWKELSAEIIEDRSMHVRAAIAESVAINKAYPEANVNWREIAYGGDSRVKINLNGQVDGESGPADIEGNGDGNEPQGD